LTRYVHIGSRLTGWNAIKSRVEQLGLELTDEQIKEITQRIKNLADVKHQSMEDVDSLLRVYHRHVEAGHETGDKKSLDALISEHVQIPAAIIEKKAQVANGVNGTANGVNGH